MGDLWSPFFINNYMGALIVLNIILIVILLTILILYLFRNRRGSVVVSENVQQCNITCDCEKDDIKTGKHKQKKNIESERVFDGVIITEEEYRRMIGDRKSDISVLLDEVNKEYEHLKELNK